MREHFAHDIGQRLAAKICMADPTRTPRRGRARGNVRDIDDEFEWKMRERVGDDAAHAAPLRPRAPQPRAELRAAVEIMRPLRGRHLGHAAEQSRRRARAHEHEAVAANDHECRPAAQASFLLRRLERKRLGIAATAGGAGAHPWTQRATRALWPGEWLARAP